MKKAVAATEVPHITRGSVIDDLGFSTSEALEIKIKADIYRDLMRYIRDLGYTQHELACVLALHQPDVSNLLAGKISRFSVGKLIKLAGKLNLGAQVRLTKPKQDNGMSVEAAGGQRRKKTVAAA